MNPSSTPRSGKFRGGRGRRNPARILRTVAETSAGGLVLDSEHRCAAVIGRIDRKGKLLWSLPKGHMEPGETQQQTAVREVAEETGVRGEVLSRLGSIDCWFIAGSDRIHKTVHHFLLEWRSGELSDADVEVSEVAWVPINELFDRLAYPDERKLVRLACELLGIEPPDTRAEPTAAEHRRP